MTGFICDMYGTITPQLDMIFVDHSELPTISLVNETAIVPYEMALLTAEVKSIITAKTFEQVKEQRVSIEKMRSKFLMGTSGNNHPERRDDRPQTIGTFIIAFESDLGQETLREWVENEVKNKRPAGICVIKSNGRMLSIYEQIVTPDSMRIEVQKSKNRDDYEPLLSFVAAVYRWLLYLLLNNSTMSTKERKRYWETHATWLWEGYLSNHLYDYIKTNFGESV
jgi:hypothetical protein